MNKRDKVLTKIINEYGGSVRGLYLNEIAFKLNCEQHIIGGIVSFLRKKQNKKDKPIYRKKFLIEDFELLEYKNNPNKKFEIIYKK